jgi:branched-chain amino acid transport system substrate-binding protein
MGYGAGYRTEGAVYGKYLLREAPESKIGVLYQNDDLGKDYLIGLKEGLGDRVGTMLVKAVSYETSDPTIDSQAVSLQAAGCNAVFTAATPKWAAQMIRKIADLNWKPLHLIGNVSSSISSVINPAGPDKAIGMVTAIYGKDPTDPTWTDDPGMNEWRRFMKQYMPEANATDIFAAYAYGAAYVLVQVLRQCGADLSRANIMRQAASLRDLEVPTALPGVKLNTSPDDFRLFRSLQLQRWTGKTWQRFGPVISTST